MAWEDQKQTADDRYDPDSDEQLTADEYNNLVQEVARRAELYESANEYYVAPNGDDSNHGKSFRDAFASISRAVEQIKADRGMGVTPAAIVVQPGEHTVNNPVTVPQNVSIVGRDLKSVHLFPENPQLDFFHVDSMDFFLGLRFYDHRSPAFCFSFPRAIVKPTISGGELTEATVLYSPDGYNEDDNDADPVAVVDPPRSGSQAQVDLTVNGGKITDATVTNPGSGYSTKPVISVPAPESEQPFVTASPYPLNCSTITGPFDENGDQIPATISYPFDPDDPEVYNLRTQSVESYAPVDREGAGGGILIDGRLPYGKNEMTPVDKNSDIPASPLNSFVTAQYTQVNQGGPGHLVINGGFAQFVSSFTTFCTYGFKTKTGGEALLSNSVCDFGLEGLVAEGRGLDPYTTGDIVTDERSSVAAVSVNSGGSGYSDPTVTIDPPATGTQAQADATVNNGEIVNVTVTDSGSGYKSTPSVTVTGNGSGASLSAEMNNVGTITVENLDEIEQPGGITKTRRPEISSILSLPTSSVEPIIQSWTENGDGTFDVSFQPAVGYVNASDTVEMFELSKVNSGGHTFEYPGTGVTYNALPEYGGVTDYSVMTNEFGVGRVFHTSTDERGNFYVGDQFRVNQQSGTVTLNTDEFNLSGLNAVGPFTVDGVTRGVQLREVSNRADMVSNSGLPGNTAPTIRAVREYTNDNFAENIHDNAAHSEAFLADGDGTARDVYVVENGSFDPSNYDDDDIVLEKSPP